LNVTACTTPASRAAFNSIRVSAALRASGLS